MSQPNVYSIGAEAEFLPVLVDAVLHDRLGLGIDFSAQPLGLADMTIYVPTQRAARALSAAFAAALNGRGSFLPRILPLGGLGIDEDTFAAEEFTAEEFDAKEFDAKEFVPDVIPTLDRRLLLTQLVLQWGKALREAIVSIGPDGTHVPRQPNEVFVAARNPADAWALAGQLAALMDETLIEGVDWAKFQQLGQGNYDDYWRITLDFLKIAFEQWPAILNSRGMLDAVQHRSELIEREILRLSGVSRRGPVIAAGSTGTNAATARLLQAIAHARQGAVILPGLDLTLDEPSWALLDTGQKHASHPQSVLARLLRRLDVPRAAVKILGGATGLRARFASEALRPAETTAQWRQHKSWSADELAANLASASLIEAESEREEALAIAIVLREALEKPEQTAILITPERTLAQRVAAELGRWGIVAEDSSGQSLSRTRAGALAEASLAAVRDVSAIALLALLAHPACRLGFARSDYDARLARLEIAVLRQVDLRLYSSLASAIDEARALAGERHALALIKAMTPQDWAELTELAVTAETALAPLGALSDRGELRDWASAHHAALLALTRQPASETTLAARDEMALFGLLDEISASPDAALTLNIMEYMQFFAQNAREIPVQLPQTGHPRLTILGLLEARLLSADVVVMAGCDEKVWPPQSQTDALLNRTMREELGLSSPERRLGQTAHDFVMGFCQKRVILTRAKKRGGEPTVASRFLQRMEALGGESFAVCRLNGQHYLELARKIDEGNTAAISRPKPRPMVELRPRRLSVTKIERLRRDPYALHAELILMLPVLGPLEPDVSARDFGTKIHHVFHKFASEVQGKTLPLQARSLLRDIAQNEFQLIWDNPIFQTFDRVKIERILTQFLDWEQQRRPLITEIHTEIRGELTFELADKSRFRLSAEADRIEYNNDGSLALIDFKTGTLPGVNEVKVGFAPQLTLEAHMARLGAFKMVPQANSMTAFYTKFGGRKGFENRSAVGKHDDFMTVSADHFENLVGLLDQFRDRNTPYLARPFPKFASRFNDYDHLSRYKEWSAQDSDEGDI